jgi:hypothetical protein
MARIVANSEPGQQDLGCLLWGVTAGRDGGPPTRCSTVDERVVEIDENQRHAPTLDAGASHGRAVYPAGTDVAETVHRPRGDHLQRGQQSR